MMPSFALASAGKYDVWRFGLRSNLHIFFDQNQNRTETFLEPYFRRLIIDFA